VARTVAAWARPVVLAGLGALDADVAVLAEALKAPVLTSYKAKGVIPEGTGWAAGAAGLSPVVDAAHRALVEAADGLLLVGWDPVELRDHWLPGWRDDADGPAVVVLDATHPTDLPSRLDVVHVGDVPAATQALATAVAGEGASAWRPADVDAHRARADALVQDGPSGPATAIRAVQAAVDAFHGDVVVSLDVGAHRITASNVWRCDRPHRLLQSNGWASMGYGLPAGLAAVALGHPAVVLTGDMGLQLALGELGTARELGGTLVVVVLIDESLSLIELKQERLGHPTAGVRFGNPDLPALAAAFGGTGVEVEGPEQSTAAVADALRAGGLHLVGIRIDPSPYRRQM
jgi:acetolactate synthase-1/2/3 large subunit